MAENLMNSNHKATNQQYRDNYDVTFADRAKKKDGEAKEEGESQ